MGPPRFELELLPPQGRRMPSYPTGPKNGKEVMKLGSSIFCLFDILYGFKIGSPTGNIFFFAMLLIRIAATA
jgi:hypothetical protein